jgi:hypothetical protein
MRAASTCSPPALTGPTAGQGLLAPGMRSGDEPLTFTASDNVGISRAEIVDVTDANAPRVVAAEDYASAQTDQKASCDFSRPKPCPDLKSENDRRVARDRRRPHAAAAGDRLGRQPDGLRAVRDHRARAAQRRRRRRWLAPRRGLPGAGVARPRQSAPPRQRPAPGAQRRFGKAADVRGILRNAAGQPVAGAELRLLVRELQDDCSADR